MADSVMLRAGGLTLCCLVSIGLLLLLGQETGRAAEKSNRFVGSETCGGCHTEQYDTFLKFSKKAHSFTSIEKMKKGLTDREIQECYRCHTTGYGRPGGFQDPVKTPELKNAGCEVCHGPGGDHVDSENPKKIRRKMTIKNCEECHTNQRVKSFKFKPLIHAGAH
jgi:hypothetical protein